MSDNASVRLFYGVILQPDTVSPYRETEPQEGPAWLVYAGKVENGLSMFETGHRNVPRLAIAIKSTVRNSRDWSAVKIGQSVPTVTVEQAAAVEAFLDRYDLRAAVATGAPQWLAAPYYG